MLTIAEMEIAARMSGMDYGKYSNLLEHGFVTLPPMAEIRAQLVQPKRRHTLNPAMRPVDCYDMDGNYIRTYPSVAAAAEVLGTSRNMINSNLNGRAKSGYGYQWRWEGDEPPGKYVKEKQTMAIPSKRAPKVKICEVCGKKFEGLKNAKFCPDCRTKALKDNKAAYMRKYKRRRKEEAQSA